ncbi:MAG TPA: hypothetical protein PLL76_23970, partial [Thermoanaerobaculia bacterium]|nr:hypothetical protein [Thermoanaerobaculia bacterium]
QSYEVGLIQQTPVPEIGTANKAVLASLARRAWSMKRSLDTRTENSHAFSLPALLQCPSDSLASSAAAWAGRIRAAETALIEFQAEIDEHCFAAYSINEEDRKSITDGSSVPNAVAPAEAVSAEMATGLASAPVECESDADEEEAALADTTALTADLLSWSIGVAFGRFDLRLATGERALPPEPDPFDPLPVCSPGMLTGADGLPCATSPSGYPIDIPQDGVLLDDPGHPRDLTASARAVFDVVFGGDADARWQEVAGILDPKNHDLRAFVARAFFEQH